MNHRHLLPNEIDLLVDGEVGFGVAPLQAHVRECDECRRELDDARRIATMLEELPRFAPSYGLADRVMAQVPVFVPWHVAARDAVAAWVPTYRPLRVIALAGGSAMAAILTMAALWIATRADILTFASAAAGDQVRAVVATGTRDVIGALLGPQVFVAMAQTGMTGLAVTGAGFVLAAGFALLGLRSLAAAGRNRS
ncbi:MAG: hypothetical protein H0X64_03065 [Gemmatimonadaceae bacterium]|nr:hypothetical protein [Gemmatimonadaceae bacterium]